MRDRQALEAAARTEILARRALADLCEEEGRVDAARTHRALAEAMDRSAVVMGTSKGDIYLSLNADRAPLTVANFLAYSDEGFYDGLIFHRVIGNFMIQGGGFLPGMRQKDGTRPPIRNEAPNGLSNTRGSLAMARTSDVDSAKVQFYINVVDNSGGLDAPRYCVFGQVEAGMDVVDKIKSVPTARVGGHGDVPRDDIVILSVRRIVA